MNDENDSSDSSDANGSEANELLKECRICFETSVQEGDRFINPCRCNGTSKYIHHSCLEKWRNESVGAPAFYKCMECNYKYNFDYAYPLEHFEYNSDNYNFCVKLIFLLFFNVLITSLYNYFFFFAEYFYPTTSLEILSLNNIDNHTLTLWNITTHDEIFSQYYYNGFISFLINNLFLTLHVLASTCKINRKCVYFKKIKGILFYAFLSANSILFLFNYLVKNGYFYIYLNFFYVLLSNNYFSIVWFIESHDDVIFNMNFRCNERFIQNYQPNLLRDIIEENLNIHS